MFDDPVAIHSHLGGIVQVEHGINVLVDTENDFALLHWLVQKSSCRVGFEDVV